MAQVSFDTPLYNCVRQQQSLLRRSDGMTRSVLPSLPASLKFPLPALFQPSRRSLESLTKASDHEHTLNVLLIKLSHSIHSCSDSRVSIKSDAFPDSSVLIRFCSPYFLRYLGAISVYDWPQSGLIGPEELYGALLDTSGRVWQRNHVYRLVTVSRPWIFIALHYARCFLPKLDFLFWLVTNEPVPHTDGAGLFCGLIKHLLARGSSCPKVLVATHFHQVNAEILSAPELSISFVHMQVMFTTMHGHVLATSATADEEDKKENAPISGSRPGDKITYLYRWFPFRRCQPYFLKRTTKQCCERFGKTFPRSQMCRTLRAQSFCCREGAACEVWLILRFWTLG